MGGLSGQKSGYHWLHETGRAHGSASIYEFIQRRSDWKKIEKTVDKVSHD